jgi:hypothetical protein
MPTNNLGVVTPLDTRVAQALNEARSAAGITVALLAEHLDWLYVTVNDKLRGVQPMYTHDLADIAAAIGADPGKVLSAAMSAVPADVEPFPESKKRRCRVCDEIIPGDAHSRMVYCSPAHAKTARREWSRDYDRRKRRRAG